MKHVFRIHPGIGVARVGNSPDDFFIGPEAPGVAAQLRRPVGLGSSRARYKDDLGRIKRQGARFRVYHYTYDDAGGLADVRELTAADARIEWGVHLANRKAAAPRFMDAGRRNANIPESELIIDAGSSIIGGESQPFQRMQGFFRGVSVPLGDLLTDSAGRLIVLGGFGKSQSVPSNVAIHHFANNDGWCDDVADGPVTATVRLHGSTGRVRAAPAWVIVAPPDFAPPIQNVITLYDVVFNAMVGLHPELDVPAAAPLSFTTHIYPILERTVNYIRVSNLARRGHAAGQEADFLEADLLGKLANNEKADHVHDDHGHDEHSEHAHDVRLSETHHDHPEPTTPAEHRRHVFEHLRSPSGGGGDMPMLNALDAADPVALTDFQYKLMERWADGDFESDWSGQPPRPLALADTPPRARPHALDRAALEACVGGGFFPGIEAGRIMRDKAIYDRNEFFRISPRRRPGSITENMAVPWQADFRDCGSGWWPAQRPNQVMRGGREGQPWVPNAWTRVTMVQRWSELGFVVYRRRHGDDTYIEQERNF